MRAFGPAVHNRRKPSRKGIPQYFLGGVAVTGLVLGCAWTVYTNVFGASVYPSVNSAAFEAPVVKNPTTVAARPVRPAFNEIFASLEQQPLVMPAPENVANSLMFNERFAASAPQGELPRSVASQPVETTKLAEASPPAEAPKAVAGAEACRDAEAESFRTGHQARLERSGLRRRRRPKPRLRTTRPRRHPPALPFATWRSAPRPP